MRTRASLIALYVLASACGADQPPPAGTGPSGPSLAALTGGIASAPSHFTLRPQQDPSLCLAVRGAEDDDGGIVELAACTGAAEQLWQRRGKALVVFADKCLNVTEGQNQDGTHLQIWTCSDDDTNSQWRPQPEQFTWDADPSKCVDVTDGVYAAGTPLQLWTCSDPGTNKNQQFGWTYETTAGKTASSTKVSSGHKSPAQAGGGLRMGIHIDYDNGSTDGVRGFVQRTGIVPAMTAGYVRCKADGSFELGTAKAYIDQASDNHVPAISLAVTSEVAGDLSEAQVRDLGAAVAYGTGKGLSVEVRFGYEMNGNWSPSFHNNDPSIFQKQWAKLAPVVHAAHGLMIWSPNNNGGQLADYERWLPHDTSSVDKVALDFYHKDSEAVSDQQVSGAIGLIYPIAKKLNRPFYFGETAVTVHDGDFASAPSARGVAMKRAWLDTLTAKDVVAAYPLYEGFVWFDYNKSETDTGLASGTMQHNRFTISQDPTDAKMFGAWKAAHSEVR